MINFARIQERSLFKEEITKVVNWNKYTDLFQFTIVFLFFWTSLYHSCGKEGNKLRTISIWMKLLTSHACGLQFISSNLAAKQVALVNLNICRTFSNLHEFLWWKSYCGSYFERFLIMTYLVSMKLPCMCISLNLFGKDGLVIALK